MNVERSGVVVSIVRDSLEFFSEKCTGENLARKIERRIMLKREPEPLVEPAPGVKMIDEGKFQCEVRRRVLEDIFTTFPQDMHLYIHAGRARRASDQSFASAQEFCRGCRHGREGHVR